MPSSRRVSKTWRPLPHDNIRVRQIAFWSQIANDFVNVPVMSICNKLEGLEKLFAFHFDAAFPFLRRYFIWPCQSACWRARGWPFVHRLRIVNRRCFLRAFYSILDSRGANRGKRTNSCCSPKNENILESALRKLSRLVTMQYFAVLFRFARVCL